MGEKRNKWFPIAFRVKSKVVIVYKSEWSASYLLLQLYLSVPKLRPNCSSYHGAWACTIPFFHQENSLLPTA